MVASEGSKDIGYHFKCKCYHQQCHQYQKKQLSHTSMCSQYFSVNNLTLGLILFLACLPLTIGEEHPVYILPLSQGHHRHDDNPRHRRSLSTANLGGTPGQGYYIRMGVGTPQQMFNVLIDTGSSNFALAAAPHVDIAHFFNSSKSSTFEDIGTEVYVPYTKGDWHGYLGRDEVTIVALPNVTVSTSFALIDEASEFYIDGSDWQGILGMGYAEIARPDDSIVPFFDSLIDQKQMKPVFSMQLCGMMKADDEGGEMGMAGTLVLGGTDDSLYEGDIMYGRLHKEWYYEVIITDIKVASKSVGLPCKEYNFDKTIVDSGTTNFRLPNTVFDAVTTMLADNTNLLLQTAPRGFWIGEEVLCWQSGMVPWESFPTITLSIAQWENTTFDLIISPRQYLRPVLDMGEDSDQECYKYAIVPSETGTVIGAVIMEGYFVVFDREHKRIGFAKSTCANRNKDEFNSLVSDYKEVKYNTTACAYYKIDTDRSGLLIVAYILAGICGLCIVLLMVMVLQWQIQKCRGQYREPAEATPHTQLIEDSAFR